MHPPRPRVRAAPLFLLLANAWASETALLLAGAVSELACPSGGEDPSCDQVTVSLLQHDFRLRRTSVLAVSGDANHAEGTITIKDEPPPAVPTLVPPVFATVSPPVFDVPTLVPPVFATLVPPVLASTEAPPAAAETHRRRRRTSQALDVTVEEASTPEVSTTMLCVIVLTVHYFAIYTFLMFARSWSMLQDQEANSTPVECVMRDATNTVNYAPMLTVLFLATRMRSLSITNGNPDTYDLPQPYCKTSMKVCCGSLIAYTVLQLISGTLVQKGAELPEPGKPARDRGIDTALRLCGTFKTLAILALYVSFSLVCFALLTMQKPEAAVPAPAITSLAVDCITELVLQYFLVYLLLQMSRTMDECNGGRPSRSTAVFKKGVITVNYAPMLCVLLLVARMRATKMNAEGKPQDWAVPFFHGCVYSLTGQTLFALLCGLLGANLTEGQTEGDLKIEAGGCCTRVAVGFLNMIRWLFMIALYGSIAMVVVSVWLLEADVGETPPISTTLSCSTYIMSLYLFVYFLLWVGLSLQELSLGSGGVSHFVSCLTPAKEALMFGPMLCLLFIAARMRALQVTNNTGDPQGFVQDWMNISTWSLILQVLIVLLVGFLGKAGGGVAVFQYICVVAMYAGVVGVILGLFNMTTSNCNGKGGFLVWPDFLLSFGPGYLSGADPAQ